MGAVHVDIYKDVHKYKMISYSDAQDIELLVQIFDKVYEDYLDDSKEAMAIVNDFFNLSGINNTNNKKRTSIKEKVVKEYIDIIGGISPYTQKELGYDIFECIANRLRRHKVGVDEVKAYLTEMVAFCVENNYECWLEWVNKNYKNTYFNYDDNSGRKYDNNSVHTSDVNLDKIDYDMKYNRYDAREVDPEFEFQLNSMLEMQKNAKELVKNLEKEIKNAVKVGDGVKAKELRNKLKMATRSEIEIRKDVIELKEAMGIPLENTNRQGSIEFSSFEAADCDEHIEKKDTVIDDILDQINLKNIRKVAKDCLTPEQYLIFELYFFGGMTHDEISEISMVTRQYITKAIGQIIKKIKKNL